MKRLLLVVFNMLLILTVVSCGDNSTGPEPDPEPEVTTGTLEVTTSTQGEDLDSDGYTLAVDGSDHSIGTDETITVEDIEEGSYDAELSGVADNCSVDGDNPRSIDITAGDTTSTTFDVSCQTTEKSRIVFYSGRDGDYEIFMMGEEGGNPTNLTDNTASDQFPAISNDGTKIAFISDRSGNDHLYILNSDGSDVEQITNLSSVEPRILSWSPDDTQIVFSTINGRIYKIDADGNNMTQLSSTGGYTDFYPDWSPDGEQILFISDRDGDNDVYVMNQDGKSVQNITNDSHSSDAPRWSPDGSKIAFSSDRTGVYEVFTMNVDGTEVRQVTDNDGGTDSFPSWSPDGTEIVFSSQRFGQLDIYKIKADGSGSPINLTAYDAPDVAPFWGLVKE